MKEAREDGLTNYILWLDVNVPSERFEQAYQAYCELDADLRRTRAIDRPLAELRDALRVRRLLKRSYDGYPQLREALELYVRYAEEQFPPDPLLVLIEENGTAYIDKRSKPGGCLWIIGGRELMPLLLRLKELGIRLNSAPKGTRDTKGQPAWWTKDGLKPKRAAVEEKVEPKPVVVEAPKSATAEEPKPATVEEMKPTVVEEPKPAAVEEPTPTAVETTVPVNAEEPLEAAELQTAALREPEPASAAKNSAVQADGMPSAEVLRGFVLAYVGRCMPQRRTCPLYEIKSAAKSELSLEPGVLRRLIEDGSTTLLDARLTETIRGLLAEGALQLSVPLSVRLPDEAVARVTEECSEEPETKDAGSSEHVEVPAPQLPEATGVDEPKETETVSEETEPIEVPDRDPVQVLYELRERCNRELEQNRSTVAELEKHLTALKAEGVQLQKRRSLLMAIAPANCGLWLQPYMQDVLSSTEWRWLMEHGIRTVADALEAADVVPKSTMDWLKSIFTADKRQIMRHKLNEFLRDTGRQLQKRVAIEAVEPYVRALVFADTPTVDDYRTALGAHANTYLLLIHPTLLKELAQRQAAEVLPAPEAEAAGEAVPETRTETQTQVVLPSGGQAGSEPAEWRDYVKGIVPPTLVDQYVAAIVRLDTACREAGVYSGSILTDATLISSERLEQEAERRFPQDSLLEMALGQWRVYNALRLRAGATAEPAPVRSDRERFCTWLSTQPEADREEELAATLDALNALVEAKYPEEGSIYRRTDPAVVLAVYKAKRDPGLWLGNGRSENEINEAVEVWKRYYIANDVGVQTGIPVSGSTMTQTQPELVISEVLKQGESAASVTKTQGRRESTIPVGLEQGGSAASVTMKQAQSESTVPSKHDDRVRSGRNQLERNGFMASAELQLLQGDIASMHIGAQSLSESVLEALSFPVELWNGDTKLYAADPTSAFIGALALIDHYERHRLDPLLDVMLQRGTKKTKLIGTLSNRKDMKRLRVYATGRYVYMSEQEQSFTDSLRQLTKLQGIDLSKYYVAPIGVRADAREETWRPGMRVKGLGRELHLYLEQREPIPMSGWPAILERVCEWLEFTHSTELVRIRKEKQIGLVDALREACFVESSEYALHRVLGMNGCIYGSPAGIAGCITKLLWLFALPVDAINVTYREADMPDLRSDPMSAPRLYTDPELPMRTETASDNDAETEDPSEGCEASEIDTVTVQSEKTASSIARTIPEPQPVRLREELLKADGAKKEPMLSRLVPELDLNVALEVLREFSPEGISSDDIRRKKFYIRRLSKATGIAIETLSRYSFAELLAPITRRNGMVIVPIEPNGNE